MDEATMTSPIGPVSCSPDKHFHLHHLFGRETAHSLANDLSLTVHSPLSVPWINNPAL